MWCISFGDTVHVSFCAAYDVIAEKISIDAIIFRHIDAKTRGMLFFFIRYIYPFKIKQERLRYSHCKRDVYFPSRQGVDCAYIAVGPGYAEVGPKYGLL